MGRPLKIKKTTTKDIGFNSVGSTINPVFPNTLNSAQFLGVVGGASTNVATTAYPVIKCVAYIASDSQYRNAFIVRQKGNTKYMVAAVNAIQDEDIVAGNTYYITTVGTTNWKGLGGPSNAAVGDVFTATASGSGLTTTGVAYLVGTCVLADDSTPASGYMAIIMESNDSAQVNIAKLTNKWAIDYSDVRYVINFFTDEGSEIKSGTVGVTNALAMAESFTS